MSFKSQVGEMNDRTKLRMLRVFRGTALSLFAKVVVRTPVDTGRLRGNWQASINSPGSQLGAGYKSIVAQAKLGDSIFFTNNIPYAQVIEDGSSDQAPTGMVKVTVAEFTDIVKSKLRRRK